MAWYSILPADLIYVESWTTRVFVLLGLITIGPWAALVLFDFVLYLWRMLEHEIPVVGGRARGHQRPRAPTFHERTDGHRRVFGLVGYEEAVAAATKTDDEGVRRRNPNPKPGDGETAE